MLLAYRTTILCIVAMSILTTTKPMAHNWPHYKTDIGPDICTCAHMEAIMDHFKNKDNLTMVLGAGDEEENYTRFEGYSFVVTDGYASNSTSIDCDSVFTQNIIERHLEKTTTLEERLKLAISKLKNNLSTNPDKPILIPLNFNTQYFKNFLNNFSNKFKMIIFDIFSSYYPEHWDTNKTIENIFSSLQDNGIFYLEDCFTGFKSNKTDQYVDKSDTILPILKATGFDAKYEKSNSNAFYPITFPDGQQKEGRYIHAKKPVNLNTKLDSLKNSLAQLKNKLSNLQEKLKTLRQKIG